jgi:hypothetical protein
MDEAEWLAGNDVYLLLRFWSVRFKASKRKLRLYGCACCRRVWHLLRDARSRRAVEVAEGFADGLARLKARRLKAGLAGARDAWEESSLEHLPNTPVDGISYSVSIHEAARAAMEVVGYFPRDAAWQTSVAVRTAVVGSSDEPVEARQKELAAQAELLRDIASNPFRLVSFDSAWRTSTVATLANAAYEERTLPVGTLDPNRLAVLADALEDAGCTDEQILVHLREPSLHVRGCWAIDLLLGKE